MSKEERAIVSAINAVAKAKEALAKVSEVPSAGVMTVVIEPKWAWVYNHKGCGAELQVSFDRLVSLAKILGKEIEECDESYDTETKTEKYHFYGFIHDGIWIHAIEDRSIEKGEN